MSDNESVDYLQDGFDPWSLTVPRLRSILVTHNVQYSATAKKPQLVELFIDQVVPHSKKYLSVRARAKRSSRGIVDADSQSTTSTDFDQDLMPRFLLNKDPKRRNVALIDADTNTGWSASGVAIDGDKKMRGHRLRPIDVQEDLYWGVMKYWYPDLQLLHPN